MIPHGLTPAGDARAAEIFGISLRTWQNTKRWESLPGLRILSREGAMRRLYAEEQLETAKTNSDLEAQGKPPVPLPPIPAAGHDLDLLDLEEARLSLPEGRRVSLDAMKAYVYGDKTKLPPADHTETGEKLWYRKTIRDWDATRTQHRGPAKGQGGRPAGSKDSYTRQWGAETSAGRNRARVAELLTAHGKELTPDTVQQDLGISLRHAERLLREAREQAADQLVAKKKGLTIGDARKEVGLIPRSEGEERIAKIRTLLDEQGPELTAAAAAAQLGIGMRQANESLREARLDKIREARADRGRITTAWIEGAFGVNADVAKKLLQDSRAKASR